MLENLNPEQKKAVMWDEGPLLVLASAGTGKTRILTTRIAYILNNGWAYPWQILALTFTNKAANEMKKRVIALSESGAGWYAGDIWCGTFHSICLRILRANAAAAGLRRDFLIYGEDEQKSIVKTLLSENTTKTPAEYVEEFSRIKDKGLSAFECKDKLFQLYNDELKRLNAVDFGDIILNVLKLFKDNKAILEHYQQQFIHVLVDEFQDINSAQMQFIKYIIPPNNMENRYLFCVGDEDQSIYSWRGAEIKHILDFEKNYTQAKIIIDTNYRSTGNILGAANSLIKHNTERLKGEHELKPAPNVGAGEPVYVLTVPTDFDEARLVADTVMHKLPDEPYSNYAILIRAGSLSRLFEEEFTSRGVPYKLIGATKFYDRAEIRDAIAYLRLLVYPFDDISFMRVIGKPRRGFGPSAIAKLRTAGANLMDGLQSAQLSGRQRATADEFLSAFDFDWQSIPPPDAAQKLLERTGYIKMWRESKDVDASDRLDNIRELITNVIAKYDTLPEFLEHAALMMTDDNDSDDANPAATDAVSIMTIHAAKGLEFDTVFLPAWEEGIFPNDMAVQSGGLEEERRLAYVAITRARRRAIIINAMSRMVFGNRQYNSPSRFITEMDNRFLDFQGGAPRSYNYGGRIPTSYERPRGASYTSVSSHHKPKRSENKSLVGRLINHADLGSGVVIEDNGDILTIAFKSKGIKKVARQFVEIAD